MRIAYLSTFYPFRGGIAQFNASLYREFEKQGHQVEAFTFTCQYPGFLFPGKTQFVTEGETADEIPAQRVLSTVNPISFIKAANEIKKYNPDILIMKYWMSFFGPALGTVAKMMPKHTRVITILDNVIPHEKRFIDRPFTQYFLKHNDGFVAMSEVVQNDLLTLQPEAANIKRDHPLYDHFGRKLDKADAREQLRIHANKKTILFFGFIRDYKGLDILLQAFDLLNDTFQLVIAGESYGSFEKYQQQIDVLKNRQNVFVYNDYITDCQVPAFFSAADVCVLPYKSATQSGITSIAYHFDVPLIATDVGGLKESISHMITGLIANECTAEEIAFQIRTYFDEELQGHFEKNIHKLKKDLSWESFAHAILDFAETIEK